MRSAAVVALFATGCSFFLTKGPGAVKPGDDPKKNPCTESSIIPSLDALAGAAAIGVDAGGILLEAVRENHEPKNFVYYFGAPLLALGIAYFWSASYGTDHVEACTEYKEKAGQPSRWQIQPIEPNKQATDPEKPSSIDDITP